MAVNLIDSNDIKVIQSDNDIELQTDKTTLNNIINNKIKNTNTSSSTDTYSCDYIDNLKDTYSTSETLTNKVWIDGKPIYRKAIETTSPSSTNSWTVIGSISNLDTIINLYGWVKASNKRILPIQFSEPGAEIATTILNGNIEMKVILSNWLNANCYMVAEYTKTN